MLRQKFKLVDTHTLELIQGSLAAGIAKLGVTGTALLFNIALARQLGVDQTGIFFLGIALVTIAAILSRLGLDNALLRFAAGHAAENEWPEIRAIYVRVLIVVTISAGGIAVLMWLISPWLADQIFGKPELIVPARYMTLAIVPISLLNVHAQLLKAIKKVGIALYVQNALVSALVLIGLLVLPLQWQAMEAAQLYSVAAIVAAIFAIVTWRRLAPIDVSRDTGYQFGELVSSSASLFVVSIMNRIVLPWSATILLGVWGEVSDVGQFNVARRVAMLMNFAFLAVESIAAPKFAVLFRQGETESVERVARTSTLMMMAAAAPLAALFLIAPEWVMGIFGPDFVSGAPVLMILTVGQLVNVMTGSVAYLLIMSGHEREYKNVTVLAAASNLVLGLLLIPVFGSIGAAYATAIAVASVNLISSYLVWRHLRFLPIPRLSTD